MSRRNSDAGRQAVVWLATVVVIVIGAAASGFVIIASTDQFQQPFMVWGCCFAGILLFLYLLNMRWEEPISHLKFWLSFQDRSDPAELYRAARRRESAREQFGTNAPPTIESVRDAHDHGGTWVPRSTGKSQSRRPPK